MSTIDPAKAYVVRDDIEHASLNNIPPLDVRLPVLISTQKQRTLQIMLAASFLCMIVGYAYFEEGLCHVKVTPLVGRFVM